MSQTIAIGAIIDRRAFSAPQIKVMLLCSLVTFLDGFDTQLMALTVPAIAADWAIPHAAFGLALASSLVGLALGAAVIAPFGDRVGRKPMLVWSTVVMSLSTLAAVQASEIWHLTALRFLTGIGIGVSVANGAAMISDYMPGGRRAAAVTLAYSISAVGSIAAGVFAPTLIEAAGWRSVYLFGGLAPLALVVMLALWLPESIRLLLARRPQDPRIAPLLAQMTEQGDTREVVADPTPDAARSAVGVLAPTYRWRTLSVWTLLTLNSFVVYMIVSWLPTLLVRQGWEQTAALHGAAAIQIGGLAGGIAITLFAASGRRINHAIAMAFSIGALSLAAVGFAPSTPAVWNVLLLTIGFGTAGCAFGLTALSAVVYPAEIRATGVGWSLVIGRIGAISAPIAGGMLIQANVPPDKLIGALAAPIIVCTIVAALVRREWQRT